MGKEGKVFLGIGAVTIAAVIIGAVLFSKPPTSSTPQALTDQEKEILVKSDSHQTLKENAKLSVVEFADFQCPACGAAHPINEKIKSEYKDSVNFVYRHFPLDSHKNALIASLTAEAAADQGKFWEMQNKLFNTQDEWSELSQALDIFMTYAKELGLDAEKLKADVESQKFLDKIKNDFNDGVKLGVNSTPTFFIDSQKYTGVILEADFRTILNEALKSK